MEYSLVCLKCAKNYSGKYKSQICSLCDGNLEVVYKSIPKLTKNKSPSFWDFENFLPKGKYAHYKLRRTRLIKGKEPNLYLKLETENPTGSFKDRGSVIEIGKAKEYGYAEIVCASTGNMAYSLCYYAKKAGLKARVFISNDANKDKINDIIKLHEADLTQISGDFVEAQRLATNYAKKNNAFLAGDYCYRKEGTKTILYEIIMKIHPSHIIMPVGNATLFAAVFKAVKELKDSKQIKAMPKLVAVQAKRCNPLVKAFLERTKIEYQKPSTKADAIAVGIPTYGYQALDAIRQTGGTAISVTENEMIKEQKRFHDEYGLIAEVAGVAPIAAFRKINLGKGDRVVAIISGKNV